MKDEIAARETATLVWFTVSTLVGAGMLCVGLWFFQPAVKPRMP